MGGRAYDIYTIRMNNVQRLRERFPHHKLEVYKLASLFFVKCWRFAQDHQFPDYFFRSQFLRSSLSIKTNIAEGASEIRGKEKARYYRMARRSASECASLAEDFPMVLGIEEKELESFYEDLLKICAMLTNLCKAMERRPPDNQNKRTPAKREPSKSVRQSRAPP